MSSSPQTPRGSEFSTQIYHGVDVATSNRSSHSRQSSLTSDHQQAISPIQFIDPQIDSLASAQHRVEAAHGNLADELADALDDDEEAEHALGAFSPISEVSSSLRTPFVESSKLGLDRDFQSLDQNRTWSPGMERASSDDEFAEANPSSDLSSLDLRANALQSLVRDLNETVLDGTEGSFLRLAQSLRELPTQSTIENGASRLMTTHIALTSHIANQARMLQTLTHPFVSPFAGFLEQEDVDDILPLISALLAAVPSQEGQCLAALNFLHSLTIDLGQTLNVLSDSIYMMRQNLTVASRKLRNVSEMIHELKQEADARETAVKFIEKGRWDRRLVDRQCRNVCGEVIGGFEEVCQGWRQKLFAESECVK